MYMQTYIQGFPGGSDGKESARNVGGLGSVPGLGRSPGEGNDNPLQYSCLENPHGQVSLAGYNPWGHKELEMTEQLRHIYSHTIITIIPGFPRLLCKMLEANNLGYSDQRMLRETKGQTCQSFHCAY